MKEAKSSHAFQRNTDLPLYAVYFSLIIRSLGLLIDSLFKAF